MKIRNHFVVEFVYHVSFFERKLTEFNAVLPVGLSFFAFCPTCRGIALATSGRAESEKKNYLCVLGASSVAGGESMSID